jgi:hypothetical protein
MSKFKIGDTVRCVVNGAAYKPKALGYKPDKEFIVDSIRKDSDGYVYFPKNEHGVFECDLILVKELVKTLPKSFACKNTNQKLWDKYIKWLNEKYKMGLDGDNVEFPYYGLDKRGDLDIYSSSLAFDTILSLEEWDEIVNGKQINEEVMETIEITRTQLKEIYDVACNAWKGTLAEHAGKNPFSDMVKFTQKEVDTMFKAATLDQTPVLEGIFGKQTAEIDLSIGEVDGKILFDNNRNLNKALICVRAGGEFRNIAFILNDDYNWDLVKDDDGYLCLVPTRKSKF